jgi:hypothetical protein
LHRATVLSTLYTATQGASWTRGTPWDVTNATFPCNILDGSIVCNASISDVTKLALSKRGLSGVLPTELGSLVALEEFDVSENRLNGTLPESLKQWVKLRTFNITSNNITGTLPASYAAWSHLKTFNALVNSLTGTLPPEYGRSTLNNWSASLELFGVFTNSLTGTLPADYANWSRILFFTVAQNQLSGTLPPSYRKWTRLQRVSFFDNNFTGSLPPEYAEWSSTISVFNARDNQLSGVIPERYSEWNASSGPFSIFHVKNNNLSGTLPEALASWSGLHAFVVGGNRLLGGTLPIAYRRWNTLEEFDVSLCNVSGTLPPMFSEFGTSMSIFNVNGNQLTGPLPTSYSSWTALVTFSVETNLLSGTIPVAYGQQWKHLVTFRASRNQIYGSIPAELLQLSELNFFSVGFNHLSGKLPTRGTTALKMFDAQNNSMLGGVLPSQIASSLMSICGTQIACPSSLFQYCFPIDFISNLGSSDVRSVLYLAGNHFLLCNKSATPAPSPLPPLPTTPTPLSSATPPTGQGALGVTSALLVYTSLAASSSASASHRPISSLQRASSALRLREACRRHQRNNGAEEGDTNNNNTLSSSPSLFSVLADNPFSLSLSAGSSSTSASEKDDATLSPSLFFAAGAAVGNAMLVIALAVLLHGIYRVQSHVAQKRGGASAEVGDRTQLLVAALQILPSSLLPGSIAIGYAILLQPAVSASVALLVSSQRDGRSIACGVVMLIVWVAFPVYCGYEVLWGGRCGSVVRGNFILSSTSTRVDRNRPSATALGVNNKRFAALVLRKFWKVKQYLFDPSHQWRVGPLPQRHPQSQQRTCSATVSKSNFLLQHFDAVFGSYGARREWYFLVEWSIGAVSGALLGAAEATADSVSGGNPTASTIAPAACTAALWGTWCAMIAGVLELFLVMWLRPFTVRLDYISMFLVGAAALVAELLALVVDDNDGDKAANTLTTVASVLTLVLSVVSMLNGVDKADDASKNDADEGRGISLSPPPRKKAPRRRAITKPEDSAQTAPHVAGNRVLPEALALPQYSEQQHQLKQLVALACAASLRGNVINL